MRLQPLLCLAFLLAVSLLPFSSHAMYIDKAVVNFLPEKPARQDIKVINNENENLYVKIDVLEVINPGQPNEQRNLVRNPDKVDLLVTPSRMVIPPNGTKLLRLINLATDIQEEKVYRINITPIAAPNAEKAEGTKVNIIIAYQALVLISPLNPTYEVDAKREGKMLSVTNTGNSYVVVKGGEQCPAIKNEEECFAIPPKRVYSGVTYRVELPFGEPVTLNVQGVDGLEKTLTI